jgi:hypothetical protein
MWRDGEGKCGQDRKSPLWAFGTWPEGRFARGFGKNPAGEQQRPANSG